MSSHESNPCLTSPAHLSVDLLLVAGWTNTSREKCYLIDEEEPGFLTSFLVSPIVSGVLRRKQCCYRGSFIAKSDEPEILDNVYCLLLALLANDEHQILLHSSAVCHEGSACLFVGAGGTGKTTIALDYNNGHMPLSVDRTLVAFDRSGTAIAHSTPFGDRDRKLLRPGQGRVAGLFFLEQAPEHEILPVSRWEATRRILAQTIVPNRNPASVQRVMDSVGRLVDSGWCYRLKFRKDDGFWPLIDEALSK